jgi:hypothetical protein
MRPFRSPSQPPPLSGIGYYTGSPLPVDPVRRLLSDLLGSLKGPPGIRLAETNDPSAKYMGTNLIPAKLNVNTVPAKVNQPSDLEQALLQAETYGAGVPMS